LAKLPASDRPEDSRHEGERNDTAEWADSGAGSGDESGEEFSVPGRYACCAASGADGASWAAERAGEFDSWEYNIGERGAGGFAVSVPWGGLVG
jgi:hypothetical protein